MQGVGRPTIYTNATKVKWRWGLAHHSELRQALSLYFLFYLDSSSREACTNKYVFQSSRSLPLEGDINAGTKSIHLIR